MQQFAEDKLVVEKFSKIALKQSSFTPGMMLEST